MRVVRADAKLMGSRSGSERVEGRSGKNGKPCRQGRISICPGASTLRPSDKTHVYAKALVMEAACHLDDRSFIEKFSRLLLILCADIHADQSRLLLAFRRGQCCVVRVYESNTASHCAARLRDRT